MGARPRRSAMGTPRPLSAISRSPFECYLYVYTACPSEHLVPGALRTSNTLASSDSCSTNATPTARHIYHNTIDNGLHPLNLYRSPALEREALISPSTAIATRPDHVWETDKTADEAQA